MTARELVATLRSQGISLHLDGDDIRCRGPVGTIAPECRQQLTELKPEVLAVLRKEQGIPQVTLGGGHVVCREVWCSERCIIFTDEEGVMWRFLEGYEGVAWPVSGFTPAVLKNLGLLEEV